jgi:CMP-N,N'-diacetyllegionaminic acid synthase
MIEKLSVLALIPARWGSKGIPNKNIIDFLGKPLFVWSIESASKSKYIDKVLLSTDSQFIANIGLSFGADVPFLRPKNISQDKSTTQEVICHAIKFLEGTLNQQYDVIILLEPTSPLRTQNDIDDALEKLIDTKNATSLVSVGQAESQDRSIQFKISDGNFIMLPTNEQEFTHSRRQDIKGNFYLDGTIYISYIDTLLAKETFVHEQTLAYLLPKWKTIEIDDEYDYEMAAALGRKYLL